MKKIIATIEARMTSSRFPGKVLKEAHGRPMLEYLIERLKKVPSLDGIVLATTVNRTDDPVVELAKHLKISYFRGSEEDVLLRVLKSAESRQADVIVEITGDCPLIDRGIVEEVIQLYLDSGCDYASNVEPVSFPIGMDVQVFSTQLLAEADREGKTQEDREHVSWYIRKRLGSRFSFKTLEASEAARWPELSLTLDEREDFELISRVIGHFHPDIYFSCADIVEYLKRHPELLAINKGVARR